MSSSRYTAADLEEEEEDEGSDGDASGQRIRTGRLVASDAEDSEDDEEDEEEDEDEGEDDGAPVRKPASKRPRKEYAGVEQFFEREAVVVDEEDVSDEGDEDLEDLFADEKAEAAAIASSAADRSRHRSMLRKRMEEEDAREIARDLEYRHRDYAKPLSTLDDLDDDRSEIAQQSLLPSVTDPKLWLVRCKPNKEREAVVCIMQKYINTENEKTGRMLIKSAIACDNLKGYIYVEADKEPHVRAAIQGLRTVFTWDVKLVPIKEMPSVLQTTKKTANLEADGWVRIKRGTYKGDIAQIYDVDDARGRVTVKLIPRLDLSRVGKEDEENREDEEGGDKKRKRSKGPRPGPRFFNVDEVTQVAGKESVELRKEQSTGDKFYLYAGQRFKDGYLIKTMNVKSLETQNVVPSLDEVQKFQDRRTDRDDDDEDSSVSASLLSGIKKRKVHFVKGDVVKVIEGDLKLLMGTVESVGDDDMVVIMPNHPELTDLLTLRADQLAKHFKTGDHVKVISGRYEGETGFILRVDNNVVTFCSDVTMKEIQVLAQDIQEAAEVASGSIQLGNYELHDLVQIDMQAVGVIVKVERDSFKILNNEGNVVSMKLQEVGNKRHTRHATAFDKNQNPITQGDVVQVVDGAHKGRQGTVRHIYRYYAFLHSKEVLDNTGMFVVRVNSCILLGGNKNKRAGGLQDRGRGFNGGFGVPMSPSGSLMSPGGAYRSDPTRGRGSPDFGRGRGRGFPGGRDRGGGGRGRGGRGRGGRDSLVHKTVVITSGQWKGYVGIVTDATDTTARVELHTNCKTVNVDKTYCEIRDSGDESSSSSTATSGSWGGGSREEYPPQSPYPQGSRTPMLRGDPDGMQTPLRTGTPLRPDTPSSHDSHDTWNPHAPNTPLPPSRGWDNERDRDSDYTVATPGYHQPFPPYSPAPSYSDSDRSHIPSTPGSRSYNPATPSSYGSSYPSESSYGDSDVRTPRTMEGMTPGYAPYSSSSPQQSYPATPGTPGMLPPQTPGTPGMMMGGGMGGMMRSPATPGNFDPDSHGGPSSPAYHGGSLSSSGGGDSLDWLTTDILVRIKSEAFRGGQYYNATGALRDIGDNSCRVEIMHRGDGTPVVPHDFVSVPPEFLEPATPVKKDRIKIIRGEFKGHMGSLIGIDGVDGIVKMEANLDIKILHLVHLAPVV